MSELNLGQIKGLTVNNNVVTVPSGHTLYAPGHVIQVVQGTNSSQLTLSTISYTDTGLSATITPKFASSKILVMVSQSFYTTKPSSNSGQNIKLFRNSTDLNISTNNYAGGYIAAMGATSVDLSTYQSFQYLDSPSSTSPVTYKTQGACHTTGTTLYYQVNNQMSMITLMEIAA